MSGTKQKSLYERSRASRASEALIYCNHDDHLDVLLASRWEGGTKSLGKKSPATARELKNLCRQIRARGGLSMNNFIDSAEHWLEPFDKTQITISSIAGHFPTEGGAVRREDGFPHGKARFEPW